MRTRELSVSAPHKHARVESTEITSDVAPIADSSTSAPPLPLSFLHPHFNFFLKVQSQDPSSDSRHSPTHLYDIVHQQSVSPESPAALLNLL
jgi:hypothetical protein